MPRQPPKAKQSSSQQPQKSTDDGKNDHGPKRNHSGRRTLEHVAEVLRNAEDQWQAIGITRIRVFGSVARGEANDLSDVDLLVDLRGGSGLLTLMAAKDLFEDLLRPRIDLLTEAAIKPPLRREILADAVDIYNLPKQPKHMHRRKRWRWRVYDLLDALDRIDDYTKSHTLESFQADELTVDAVLRNLSRLGETTKFVPQRQEDLNPEIPWAFLRDIRNLVAHDYFGIDPGLVWHTSRHELPALRPKLQDLAEGKDEDDD